MATCVIPTKDLLLRSRETIKSREQTVVYLAYLDDSDTKAKSDPWKVICAVIIEADVFGSLETLSSFAIEDLMPEERRKDFQEFHACELYRGHEQFEGIDQEKRLKTLEYLLSLVEALGLKIAYGAVNVNSLRSRHYGSANPLDVAFRMCVSGIADRLESMAVQVIANGGQGLDSNYALLIADDCDKGDKATLLASFRSLRKRLRGPEFDSGTLRYLHDDMYFGDSRYSIGIQIADSCAYFIARHLSEDKETEHFYKMIEPHIVSGKREE